MLILEPVKTFFKGLLWKMFYTDGSGVLQSLALGAKNAPLLSGGTASAPIFGTLLLAPSRVDCAGAIPVLSDFAEWANSTIGVAKTTDNRIFTVVRYADTIYIAEGTSIDVWDALVGEGTPSSANKYITRTYLEAYTASVVLGLAWQEAVTYTIQYVKEGVPTGTATVGEKCLNTTGLLLHTYEEGTGWNAGVEITHGLRLLWKGNGSDVTGDSGTHTADMAIREVIENGEIVIIEAYVPAEGTAVPLIEDSSVWRFNGSSYAYFISIFSHNNLANIGGDGTNHISTAQLAAIQAANLTETDTVAKLSDIPAIPEAELTAGELAAIQAANLTETDTVAKLSDITTPAITQLVIPHYEGIRFISGTAALSHNYMLHPPFAIASYQQTGQLNDEWEHEFYCQHAMTTTLRYWHNRYTNMGILSLYLNDVLIDTRDLYGTGEFVGAAIVDCNFLAGTNKLRGKMAARNPSSTAYHCSLYGFVIGT